MLIGFEIKGITQSPRELSTNTMRRLSGPEVKEPRLSCRTNITA